MARPARATMTRGEVAGHRRSPPEPHVNAGVRELTEMTYRSNRRSEEPVGTSGFRGRLIVWGRIADPIWASGHAPRQQAGHMIAIDPPVRILIPSLAPKGPSTHGAEERHHPASRAASLDVAPHPRLMASSAPESALRASTGEDGQRSRPHSTTIARNRSARRWRCWPSLGKRPARWPAGTA